MQHHVRIQDFLSGGGGGGGSRLEGQINFFCLNLFYSLHRGSDGFITEKTILSKDPEGVQHFPGGNTFP